MTDIKPGVPDWTREVRTRLSSLRLLPTREGEIVEELSQHLDDRWRALMAGGASPEEATALTLGEFRHGNVLAKYMAPLRQAQSPPSLTPGTPGGRLLTDLTQDLRYAARMLRMRPGFAAVAILTLALGVGATTAIFSVVYGVLLKPLPLHEPDRLVGLYHSRSGDGTSLVRQGPATYFTYRDHNRVFEDVGAWNSIQVSITGRGEPERVEALSVTDGTLPLLRVQPVLGRLFSKEDDAPGSPPRVILTYGYWLRRFGGAEDVIGHSLRIDDTPREIVGVLPSSFEFLRTDPEVLLPMRLDRANVWLVFYFRAIARLKPGVTFADANADVARMIPRVVEWVPGLKEWQLRPNVRPLAHDVIGDVGRVLWILLATVGIVLLIACANVANLFLVRAERRHQELAVRAALGASRGRLARELMSESLMLGLAGGVVGLLFAKAGIEALRMLAPTTLPRVNEIGIDPIVLLFALAVSVLSGLLFGLIPALKLGMTNTTALKDGRATNDVPGRHRTRNTLVVTEIALALVLLIGSALMIRTFVALRHVHPGFVRPTEVQTFRIAVPGGLLPDPQHVARLHAQIAERLNAVPGVVSVGLASSITMDGETNGNPTFVEGVPIPTGTRPPHRRFKYIGPGYFETMGNRVVAGRRLTWDDVHQARPVIVISENLARQYWRDATEALGKRITNSPGLPWREIVGVVGDEHDDGLNQPATTIVYWPMLIAKFGDGPLTVRRTMAYAVRSTRVGTPAFLGELQQAVWSVNPNLPLASVQILADIQAKSMAQTSFAMVMLAIAAGVALLLGVVGVYGVTAYIAAQRTREIGIRMALGAQTGDVRRLFLRHGLLLAGIGIAVGVSVSLALTRVMSALLFGVGPMDPVTYAAVSAGVAAFALLATWLPARRASRIDPLVALRSGM
jgi:predicted permease